MEICRAFTLFEFVLLIISVISLVITSTSLIYIAWYEYYYVIKSKRKILLKPTCKKIVFFILITIMWICVIDVYSYIKSMFC